MKQRLNGTLYLPIDIQNTGIFMSASLPELDNSGKILLKRFIEHGTTPEFMRKIYRVSGLRSKGAKPLVDPIRQNVLSIINTGNYIITNKGRFL